MLLSLSLNLHVCMRDALARHDSIVWPCDNIHVGLTTCTLTCIAAGVIAEAEIIKQEALIQMLPTQRLHSVAEALQTLVAATEQSETGNSQILVSK